MPRPNDDEFDDSEFNTTVQPDEILAAIIGSTPLQRSAMAKRVWDYIVEHKLQVAKKPTLVNADDALTPVFNGRKQVTMFEMTQIVSGHIRK